MDVVDARKTGSEKAPETGSAGAESVAPPNEKGAPDLSETP